MTRQFLPYSKQHIDDDDIRSVVEVLRSDYLTQGPKVIEFEEKVAVYCGAEYAVSFCNGTAALHALMLALEMGPEDTGIVPPITFAATANALLYCQSKPKFIDVTPGMPQMDPSLLEAAITDDVKVVLPVYFSGMTCNIQEIHRIASQKKLAVIEDGCHALGARYVSDGKEYKVGSCQHSLACVFSFHPVKNITCGEGAMVTTNDRNLRDQLKAIRHHGIHYPSGEDKKPLWFHEMNQLGFNYRLTDIHAALGVSQLEKIEDFRRACLDLWLRYEEKLQHHPLVHLLGTQQEALLSGHHLAVVQVDPSVSRDGLFQFLRDQQIGVQLHYIPVYRHPYFVKNYPVKFSDFPVAENYYKTAMSIPLYPSLSSTDQDYILACLEEGVRRFSVTTSFEQHAH